MVFWRQVARWSLALSVALLDSIVRESAFVVVAELSLAPRSGLAVQVLSVEVEGWSCHIDQQGLLQGLVVQAQAVGSRSRRKSAAQARCIAAEERSRCISLFGLAVVGMSRSLNCHSPSELAWGTAVELVKPPFDNLIFAWSWYPWRLLSSMQG